MGVLFSAWIPTAVLVCMALAARAAQGSWLAPSAFAPAVWSIFIVLPLLALTDRVRGSTGWAIVAMVFFLQFGSFLTENPGRRERIIEKRDELRTRSFGKYALRGISVFVSVALVGTIIFAIQGLRKFDLTLSLDGFLKMGALYYPELVGGDATPWWFRLTRMWTLPAVVLSGIVSGMDVPRLKKLLCGLSLLPVAIESVIFASRFTLTMSVCLWISGYLAAKAYSSRGLYRFGRKTVVAAFVVSLSASILYLSLGVVRGHEYADSDEASIAIRSNLLGYLPVFDNWLQSPNQAPLAWGSYSIAGVFDLLGVVPREVALGYEPVVLDSGVDSNVETAFRGLVQDFSFMGGVLVCSLMGMLAGKLYYRASRRDLASALLLAGYYAFLIWSPIVSIFNYNSVILAFLVALFLVRRSAVAAESLLRLSTKAR